MYGMYKDGGSKSPACLTNLYKLICNQTLKIIQDEEYLQILITHNLQSYVTAILVVRNTLDDNYTSLFNM